MRCMEIGPGSVRSSPFLLLLKPCGRAFTSGGSALLPHLGYPSVCFHLFKCTFKTTEIFIPSLDASPQYVDLCSPLPTLFLEGNLSLFFGYPQRLSVLSLWWVEDLAIEGKSHCLPTFWDSAKVHEARITKEQSSSLEQGDLSVWVKHSQIGLIQNLIQCKLSFIALETHLFNKYWTHSVCQAMIETVERSWWTRNL